MRDSLVIIRLWFRRWQRYVLHGDGFLGYRSGYRRKCWRRCFRSGRRGRRRWNWFGRWTRWRLTLRDGLSDGDRPFVPDRRRHRRRFFANGSAMKRRWCLHCCDGRWGGLCRLGRHLYGRRHWYGKRLGQRRGLRRVYSANIHRPDSEIHDPRSEHGSGRKSRYQFPIHLHVPSFALTTLNARRLVYVSDWEPLK
jgi:hypothetical protein